MKIGLLSPTFPPDRCGVGDHSGRLLARLEAQGHAVTLFRALDEVRTPDLDLDLIIAQYTPYLWGSGPTRRFPVNPRFVLDLGRFRRRSGIPLALIAHELHGPWSFSAKTSMLSATQRMQFLALTAACDWIFFTYDAARDGLLRIAPWVERRSSILPVGSAIDVRFPRVTRTDGAIELLHFGGNHPTHLLSWTVHALDAVVRAHPGREVRLSWVGVGESARTTILRESGRPELDSRVSALGYLREEEVSRRLSGATLVLAPFLDGISTRRSSAMACFQHASPVVTTEGWATSRRIPWREFCRITPVNLHAFMNEVVAALRDGPPDGAAAGRAYTRFFDWERISQDLIAPFASSKKRPTKEMPSEPPAPPPGT
jgi:glycosyltransferase involved in cell wall biosynthesis